MWLLASIVIREDRNNVAKPSLPITPLYVILVSGLAKILDNIVSETKLRALVMDIFEYGTNYDRFALAFGKTLLSRVGRNDVDDLMQTCKLSYVPVSDAMDGP